MDDLLSSIQHHLARVAINSSSMRRAGSPGVVAAAREFLGSLPLHQFGTSSETEFLIRLDAATNHLIKKLPKKARRWGRARKGLNIFLRDCLYTAYIRDAYRLGRAERFFEVPLDSIIGARLVKESPDPLPHWTTVRAVTRKMSKKYQAAARKVAGEMDGLARVHLDAIWWGAREVAERKKAKD